MHEAGRHQFTGHKVLTLPTMTAKSDATELDEYCATFYADAYTHIGVPRMRLHFAGHRIRHALRSPNLRRSAKVCTKYDMPLFIDGARLGYALTATGNDVTLEDIARIADVFYIGGTKVGAMFGEVVFHARQYAEKLRDARQATWRAARQGMAAGRAVRHAVHRRSVLQDRPPRQRCGRPYSRSAGGTWLRSPSTRRPIRSSSLDNATSERLQRNVRLGFMEKADDTHTVMRICTSWATTDEQVEQLIALL